MTTILGLEDFFMKRHLGWAIASVILVGGVGGALAADMPVKAPPPPPPPPSWSGFYLGADVGGGGTLERECDLG